MTSREHCLRYTAAQQDFKMLSIHLYLWRLLRREFLTVSESRKQTALETIGVMYVSKLMLALEFRTHQLRGVIADLALR